MPDFIIPLDYFGTPSSELEVRLRTPCWTMSLNGQCGIIRQVIDCSLFHVSWILLINLTYLQWGSEWTPVHFPWSKFNISFKIKPVSSWIPNFSRCLYMLRVPWAHGHHICRCTMVFVFELFQHCTKPYSLVLMMIAWKEHCGRWTYHRLVSHASWQWWILSNHLFRAICDIWWVIWMPFLK